jgi:acetoin utilization protein AcuC
LDLGAERIAYVDVDVHHGDGVQHVFWDDPRVLTISLHETPLALFPGTGFPDETGGPDAQGSAVNVPLPPGTGDAGWQRAFHAIVPSVLRAFRPQLLVTQCGADGHRADPADLRSSTGSAPPTQLRALADESATAAGHTGGGGNALRRWPPAWSHLLAIATGDPVDSATLTAGLALAAARRPHQVPLR